MTIEELKKDRYWLTGYNTIMVKMSKEHYDKFIVWLEALSNCNNIEQKVLPTETCSLCGDTSFEGRYGLLASLQAVAEDQRNFCPNCGRAI